MLPRRLMACFITLFLLGQNPAPAADRGIQFIGTSRTSAADIRALGSAIRASRGPTHVSLLPFEFNPTAPFDNATLFIRQTLPAMNESLTVTLYASWFPHDPRGEHEQRAFWAAWQPPSPSAEQRLLREAYLDRVGATNRWIVEMLRWAGQNGFASRLNFVIVPVLEDTCPIESRRAYRRLVTATRALHSADGVTRTAMRRSCVENSVFRLEGLPLELHGSWRNVRDRLEAGDTWSNDGTPYTEADFLVDARAASHRGVTVLLWRAAYNGEPNGWGAYARNWPYRTVTPFTGRNGCAETRLLTRVLGTR